MNKPITILLFILLLLPLSSAYTYLNIYIDETGEALFLGETNEQLELPDGIEIQNQIIKGKTNSLTNKQAEIWEFSYSLQGAELNIILPKGTIIKEISNGEISSNGNIEIYVQESIEIKYTIKPSQNYDYLFYLLGLLIILAVFIYFFKLKIKTNKKEQENLEIVKQTLNKRQQTILNKLEEVKEIKHSQLQKLVEIPKASFSRHIQELEKKGLIKRVGEGKNKLIRLR